MKQSVNQSNPCVNSLAGRVMGKTGKPSERRFRFVPPFTRRGQPRQPQPQQKSKDHSGVPGDTPGAGTFLQGASAHGGFCCCLLIA